MSHRISICAALLLTLAPRLVALDPPHNATRSVQCTSCHNVMGGPGGGLTAVAGNANLCASCHIAGGLASAKVLSPSDQAIPGPGLPGTTQPSGSSHRWDSSPAGHLTFGGGAATASTGKIRLLGAYTGPYPKAYTLTITASGTVGVAQFSWTATSPGGGSGSNLVTGVAVPLDQGVSLKFMDGPPGVSFQVNDRWTLYVRPDLRAPSNAAMAVRQENGQMMCSTCHDQHTQAAQPFDPAARTGGLKHYQRIPNESGQMCAECHAARNVTAAASGSHPVNVTIPAGNYKAPGTLPLDPSNRVQCQTCHKVHYAATSDGTLGQVANTTALCTDCHTLADTASPARHLNPATGVLWPGGQYGSTFPAKTGSAQRGSCANCHQPHGWPDAANPTQDYAKLLVDAEEKLCHTCHDANGPATKNLQAEFAKTSKHPIATNSGVHTSTEPAVAQTRHVECGDCHNSHQAKARVNLPGAATAPRPASGPLAGVRGVNLNNAEVNPAAFEYEVCLRCHGDSPNKPAPAVPRQFNQTNVRLEFGGAYPSFHAVAAKGKNPSVPSLRSGWTVNSYLACTSCHNNNAGPGNNGTGPNGPHGSTYPRGLERAYVTTDNTSYSLANYALCNKCHDVDRLVNGLSGSFREHRMHIESERTPCSVCHDPHASSGNAKLINFDTRAVTAYNGKIEWRSTGTARGTCTLTCHGEVHNAYTY